MKFDQDRWEDALDYMLYSERHDKQSFRYEFSRLLNDERISNDVLETTMKLNDRTYKEKEHLH